MSSRTAGAGSIRSAVGLTRPITTAAGRNRNNRWFWVPPRAATSTPVYAPALVAFVGGTELGLALGAQSQRPVGWFPLGPREAYVPPYTADRRYYQRINANARVPEAALNDRWQRAEHHEALRADRAQRGVRQPPLRHRGLRPTTFARSQPVQQARLHVAADKIATAPVAAVSAPPAPTMALAAQAAKPGQPQPQAQADRPSGSAGSAGPARDRADPLRRHGDDRAAHAERCPAACRARSAHRLDHSRTRRRRAPSPTCRSSRRTAAPRRRRASRRIPTPSVAAAGPGVRANRAAATRRGPTSSVRVSRRRPTRLFSRRVPASRRVRTSSIRVSRRRTRLSRSIPASRSRRGRVSRRIRRPTRPSRRRMPASRRGRTSSMRRRRR